MTTQTVPGARSPSRFVAGETLAEALAVARDLTVEGLPSMLNHLGENVDASEAGARRP